MMPREKLKKLGASTLTKAELLAILLRTGTKETNVFELSDYLLSRMDHSLYRLQQSSAEEIMKARGMGEVKTITIKAALELGARLYSELMERTETIKKPSDVFKMCRDMTFNDQEVVRVISIDSKSNVLAVEDITKGTKNASLLHPREVFRSALVNSSVSFALVHNHPSGDPTPSDADNSITDRIRESAGILGNELLDHIIIGKGRYYSFTLNRELQGGDWRDEKKERRRSEQIAEA